MIQKIFSALKSTLLAYPTIHKAIIDCTQDNYSEFQHSIRLYHIRRQNPFTPPRLRRQSQRDIVLNFLVILSTPLVYILCFLVIIIGSPFIFLNELIHG